MAEAAGVYWPRTDPLSAVIRNQMQIAPDKETLSSLMNQATNGRLCLPNFQRDFVWPRGEVADLLRSVLRGYYIGSLLLLGCDPDKPPFGPQFLRGTDPPTKKPRPDRLVLDGQQRLSALVYALTAPNLRLKDSNQRRYFFVDLNVALSDPDSDALVLDYGPKELAGLDQPETQYRRRVLPCTALLSPQAATGWLFGFQDYIEKSEPEAMGGFKDKWRHRWNDLATNFAQFTVPLVNLPRVSEEDDEGIGKVCAIFEKLNSSGVQLSIYDLLTARLYPHGVKLHELWRAACARHKLLREWSGEKADTKKFGVTIIRTLALLRDHDPKPGTLIKLSPDGFEDDWERAADAVERSLELLVNTGPDGFGVFKEKWMPLMGQLPALAALRRVIDEKLLGHTERAQLRQWYWSNVFLERYSSSTESKSRKDYAEFTAHWLKGAPAPAVLADAQREIGSPTFSIAGSLSHASAVYCGIFCLLAKRGARDWRWGEDIAFQRLEDHHIFPRAFLKAKGITGRAQVNTILNRTLISNKTNSKIRAKAPGDYATLQDIFPNGPTEEVLRPHFISGNARSRMLEAKADLPQQQAELLYERFRQARESEIVAEIRRVCGVASIGAPSGA